VQLLAGPLFHAAPFSRLLDGILSGNCLVLPRLFRPEVVIDTVVKLGVEWAQLTPSHMEILRKGLEADPDAFRTLRGLLHTAAPCPEETKRAWIAGLGGSRVHEMYTTTEGFGTTYCDGDEWLRHPGSVGRGFFTKIAIRGADGSDLAPGEVGTVYMRGVASGGSVSGDAGAVEPTDADGYATAGDRGHLDAEGYLYLSGRREDLIIVGGQNVYAHDIEAVLSARGDVRHAVVVPLRDDVLGERVCAVIVLDPSSDASAQDLLRECAARLPAYKCPSKIVFAQDIPLTAVGKIDRRAVRTMAGRLP
jgi:bile acid-coenzyme A ligase